MPKCLTKVIENVFRKICSREESKKTSTQYEKCRIMACKNY